MPSEPMCEHYGFMGGDSECVCGAPVLTTEQVRQLMVLRDEYDAEPDPEEHTRDEDASMDATERDLEYWDRVAEILGPVRR